MTYHIVATEGPTVDGRNISGEHLEQMARNYDPSKYQARIWPEHMRFYGAAGDVTGLKTAKNNEGKTQLLAEIKPLPHLLQLNQQGQKLYSSVEINTNFAETGEAYLVGLAITDSPASIGTSRLAFTVAHYQERGKHNHMYSPYTAYEAEQPPAPPPTSTAPSAAAPLSTDFAMLMQTFAQQQANQAQQLAMLTSTVSQLASSISAFATHPAGVSRPAATGNSNNYETDC